MARKQEKPESTVEPKDTASTTESSGSQPQDGALSLSPGEVASPNPGEAGASAADSGLGAEQTPPEAPEESGAGSGVAAGDLGASAGAAATEAGPSVGEGQGGPTVIEAGDDTDQPAAEDLVAANPNPVTLQIYPMRSYMDEGELRRRGGPAYVVPRRHAEELVRRKLASLEPLKE
ncbi:hypothetical protein PPUJ20028_33070 [Pseudomonas putida]|uniref:Uncharacterized protein n=1 Tax=Pseudomonas putida TaxID=303 RepID=A0AA37VVK4_PSEPU|nr:hypothetical protein [Pseudomonas putida]GLO14724.1 hypothetical protein PPUJ20028_33070 [Pseudomonas putida]GLO34909.1 hypothetical protein PPUN14671_17420 [Pseudomonas putida]HDS0963607.1 hypothetical protein [Pseudomonas putida]HDS0988866.1 hypothetical protein [Pseudomonas putida]